MAEMENKIYVGGLGPETSKEQLEAQFRQYGEIVDCVVMVDKASSRSRGFGFVTFREPSAANSAIGTANFLDGREVSCKKAVRDAPKQLVQEGGGVYNSLKIFVGGLPSSCDYEKLTGYFGRFGQIQDAVVMMDQQTQRHRGFGYVTFSDSSAVEAALQMYPENKIDGKWIEVKRCIPQETMRSAASGGQGGGPTASASRGGGGGAYDPPRAGCGGGCGYPPPPARGYADHYDPYAASRWYGGMGADPYGAYRAAYGAYPHHMPAHSAYAAYGMAAYPQQAYGGVYGCGARCGGCGHRGAPY